MLDGLCTSELKLTILINYITVKVIRPFSLKNYALMGFMLLDYVN